MSDFAEFGLSPDEVRRLDEINRKLNAAFRKPPPAPATPSVCVTVTVRHAA